MENDVIQEDILESESLNEDDSSYVEDNSIEEKLDHVEALLNENITLLESEKENDVEIEEDPEITETVSGNTAPDYDQYIYDLLTDSNIRVEVVQSEDNIFNKPLNDYTVSEGFLVIIILLLLVRFMGEFIEKYVFKRR